jgi:hypothetical protein
MQLIGRRARSVNELNIRNVLFNALKFSKYKAIQFKVIQILSESFKSIQIWLCFDWICFIRNAVYFNHSLIFSYKRLQYMKRFLYRIQIRRIRKKHQNSNAKRIGERLEILLRSDQFAAAENFENAYLFRNYEYSHYRRLERLEIAAKNSF